VVGTVIEAEIPIRGMATSNSRVSNALVGGDINRRATADGRGGASQEEPS